MPVAQPPSPPRDQFDLALLHALQIAPRASWAQLSAVLATDPSTLSRRWRRLVDERLAWTTCGYIEPRGIIGDAVRPLRTAIVEVVCLPGHRGSVIEVVSSLPYVTSVYTTSGARDLYLLVSSSSLQQLDHIINGLYGLTCGIGATRTHHVRTLFQEASSWRLGVLHPSQRDALRSLRTEARKRITPSPVHFELMEALGEDARRSITQLQSATGRSPAAITRGIDELLVADWARWRIDFAHEFWSWDASLMLWISVDQIELEKVAAALCLLPQVRMCASIAGQANLAASMWLRDIAELDDIEAKLTQVFRRLRIVDRWVTPRVVKRVGHVLDTEGRWLRYVSSTMTAVD